MADCGELKNTELDGKKVRFSPGHPHEGETGTIMGAKLTAIGWGMLVKLDNCQHATESCFLFKPEDGQVYDEPIRVRGRRRK